MSLFGSGMLMASFVFTPSTVHTWGRFFRRKFGQKVEEPLKLQKHKVIAQAFAKRKEFQDQERVSISFHNSHTDPVGLKFDLNSAVGSNDFSSTWANNLPRFVNRRCALTGCASSSSHGHRRTSVDSEISISVRTVAVESRRNSTESQVSVQIAEMKTVKSRSRGPKLKTRSRQQQYRYSSRKESSTSMESQIIAMTQKGSHHQSTATTAEMGIMVPVGTKRRTGIAALDQYQINELIAKNKNLLPFLTTSEDEKSKSSIGSFNMKTEEFLKHLGLSHKIIAQESNYNEDVHIEDYDSNSENKNLNSDVSETGMNVAGRNSKNSNRSIGSKKSLKTGNSSRLRKTRKSMRSISKTANPLVITNGSGRIKTDKSEKEKKSKDKFRSKDDSLSPMGMELTPMNLQGSYSGRSDVGIQTETFSSMEQMMKHDHEDDDDYEPMENHKLLHKRVSLSSATKRRDTREISLTESQKLELLLLPSN